MEEKNSFSTSSALAKELAWAAEEQFGGRGGTNQLRAMPLVMACGSCVFVGFCLCQILTVRQREESEPHGLHLVLTLKQTNKQTIFSKEYWYNWVDVA
jgi:hypothetical protein